jgi:hypothetical protein
VAMVLPSRAMAALPPARRSPMIPEPMTTASSRAVPKTSATMLRLRLRLRVEAVVPDWRRLALRAPSFDRSASRGADVPHALSRTSYCPMSHIGSEIGGPPSKQTTADAEVGPCGLRSLNDLMRPQDDHACLMAYRPLADDGWVADPPASLVYGDHLRS